MKRKLLYIEDELELQITYKHLFELEGFDVMALSSAVDATEVIGQFKPDVIVCDNNLPKLSGIEFYQTLRHNNIETPFILISGDIGEATLEKVRKLQITHVLEKPCEFDQVCELIRNLIQSQSTLTA